MSTPGAVLGKYANGTTYGLKTSLPGINALTDDDTDPSKFSFNSEWTDIVRPHQIGIVNFSAVNTIVPFPNLGFRPFYEIRRMIGSVICDDRMVQLPPPSANAQSGIFSDIASSFLKLVSPVGDRVIYVIYKQRAV
ncbi:hypothetical protein ACSVBT_07110 [Afipia sp. TerB]